MCVTSTSTGLQATSAGTGASSARACKLVGVITPLLLLPCGHHSRAGSPDSVDLTEGVLECVVQHGCAHVQEGLHGRSVPAHLLRLVHALGHDLIHCALHERR